MGVASPASLLNKAYESLGYSDVEGERFFGAQDRPTGLSEKDWTEKGDWLVLAHEVGAERVFFLENNPVAVFARLDVDDAEVFRHFYNQVWSMSRPRLLFLARPGEIAVYDLAQRPPKDQDDLKRLKPLEIARSVAEVAQRLKAFRREEIEAGRIFEAEYRFGDLKNRADKALISDLKEVRRQLIQSGLGGKHLQYAHALIGRSIFIRYLEDRGVLTRAYFSEVARDEPRWQRALEKRPAELVCEQGETGPLFPRVLASKTFTYALFRKLADDFNGDMFPNVGEEEKTVRQRHLNLIRDLMYGEVGPQRLLFFYAYRFKIVPIELISSIYEEFYHEVSGSRRSQGAYYTPPALVEFVLSQALPPDRLAENPRILDPACGSGIFLVESFRRIVRYRVAKQGRRLRFDELQKILRDQLAGIDINPEAVRVAAFSLYLALLHYLDPPDIREQIGKGNHLPNLVVDEGKPDSFNTLLAANAFDTALLESDFRLRERFLSSCADVIVGNPPWGSSGKQNQVAIDWCADRDLPVGDRELSQAFIWRSLDLLRPDGVAGMLVSTGVFFKHHPNSVSFRRLWLDSCNLELVFNFAHTRKVFFKAADSPFAAVVFRKVNPWDTAQNTQYWSARSTRTVEDLQSIVFSQNDLRLIRNHDDPVNYRTWKTLWWGSHRDRNLISQIQLYVPLGNVVLPNAVGGGFQEAPKHTEADWLERFGELPEDHIKRYGETDLRHLAEVPHIVWRRGCRGIYEGLRILVKRGISQESRNKGSIIARLETKRFCFRRSSYGFKLRSGDSQEYKVVLGVLWSKLARYYLFLTSSSWGIWHDEIHLGDELLSLPVCFPQRQDLGRRIIRIIDELRSYDPPVRDLTNPDGVPEGEIQAKREDLEARLDEAVFELYGLSEAEIDLVRDMVDTNLEYYYLREKSEAAKPVLKLVPRKTGRDLPTGPVGDYIRVFMQSWMPYLDEGTEFHWRLHLPSESNSMLAAVFSVRDKGETPQPGQGSEQHAWQDVLRRLDSALVQPVSTRVFVDGLVRAVTDEDIIIVKRNEKRLWTKSTAREDAEATLTQAMTRDRAERNT